MDLALETSVPWLWEFNSQEWGFDPRIVRPDATENFSIPSSTVTTIVTAHHWKCIRLRRDQLLAETDWWAVSDRTPTAEQIAYRQDLRDVPTQSDPDDITWPTKPS